MIWHNRYMITPGSLRTRYNSRILSTVKLIFYQKFSQEYELLPPREASTSREFDKGLFIRHFSIDLFRFSFFCVSVLDTSPLGVVAAGAYAHHRTVPYHVGRPPRPGPS